jgi:hypothetical protein
MDSTGSTSFATVSADKGARSGPAKIIELHGHDETVSGYGQNQWRSWCSGFLMFVVHDEASSARYKGSLVFEFRNFVRKYAFDRLKLLKPEVFVERDLGPPVECAASFHTTRWTIVMRAAQLIFKTLRHLSNPFCFLIL